MATTAGEVRTGIVDFAVFATAFDHDTTVTFGANFDAGAFEARANLEDERRYAARVGDDKSSLFGAGDSDIPKSSFLSVRVGV